MKRLECHLEKVELDLSQSSIRADLLVQFLNPLLAQIKDIDLLDFPIPSIKKIEERIPKKSVGIELLVTDTSKWPHMTMGFLGQKQLILKHSPIEGWSNFHILQSISLIPHEMSHFSQRQLSNVLGNGHELAQDWVVPKFIKEGFARTQERFRVTRIDDSKYVISQTPLTGIILDKSKRKSLQKISNRNKNDLIVPLPIYNFVHEQSKISKDRFNANFFEYLVSYLSVLGIRLDLTPNQLIQDTKKTVLRPKLIVDRDLLTQDIDSHNITGFPDYITLEARIVELVTQTFYYSHRDFDDLSLKVKKTKDLIRNNSLNKLSHHEIEEITPVMELNQKLVELLINGKLSYLIRYHNQLLPLLIKSLGRIDYE